MQVCTIHNFNDANLREEAGGKDDLAAHKLDKIPDDARAVGARAHTRVTALADLDTCDLRLRGKQQNHQHSANDRNTCGRTHLVFLEALDQCLGLRANLPNTNLPVATSTDKASVVSRSHNRSYTL